MFGLFSTQRDVIADATRRACRERQEDTAVDRFLEDIERDRYTVAFLHETYRTIVGELCDARGIADSTQRYTVLRNMETKFWSNLKQTAREYLREQRDADAAPAKQINPLTIEFVWAK